jgi:hypothetical protein
MTPARRVLAGLVLVLASPLTAQEPPSVQPGGVATIIVTAGPGADRVRFRVKPVEGVRLFSAAEGQVATLPGRAVRLPFTVGIPVHARAGVLVTAELTLEWSDGQRETRELVVDVATRRGALVEVAAAVVAAAPGSSAEIGYRVRNEGNAADTFHVRLTAPSSWLAPGPVATLVLPAGEEAVGAFQLRMPTSATRGEEHVVRVLAEGSDVREVRSVSVVVVGDESRLGNLATVPGSIFVGSALEEGATASAVALQARGEVRPGTRVALDLRHLEANTTAPALRSAMAGPRMRLSLDGSGWTARAGDLTGVPDLLQGPAIQTRGVEGTFEVGELHSEASIARPWAHLGEPDDGHVLRAAVRYHTDLGSFGIRAGSVRRDGQLFGGYEQAGATLTYGFRGAGHDLEAEAGALRVADDAASATGPAARLRYSLNRGPVFLSARLRAVPGTTSRTSSHGNEAYFAGDVALAPIVTMTGSAYATDASRVDGGPHAESRGATAGLRFRLPAGVNARIMGAHRSHEMVGSGADGTATRTVSIGADVPVAGIVVEADAQVGRSHVGPEDRPYRNARLGGRWSQAKQWAWLGISHSDYGVGAAHTRMELSGSARVRSAEIQGGLSARIDDSEQLARASIWTGVTVPIVDHTRLSLSSEYRGYMQDSPWRVSLGVARTFGMPMPVARAPVVQGVIFEDADGDGVRGPGEDGLADVVVTFGSLRTRTDASGRFRFYDGRADAIRVDATTLPRGMVVATGTELPSRGTATIPVVRTASLELRIFLDRDGDGLMDDGEEFAAGAVVTILGAAGRARDAAVDRGGRVRFGSLTPGRYSVTIHRPNGRAAVPVETVVVLVAGANEQMMVGIPYRGLPIRLPNGEPLAPPLAPNGSEAGNPGDPTDPVGAPAEALGDAEPRAQERPHVRGDQPSAETATTTETAETAETATGDAIVVDQGPDEPVAVAPATAGPGAPTSGAAERGPDTRLASPLLILLVLLLFLLLLIAAGEILRRLAGRWATRAHPA